MDNGQVDLIQDVALRVRKSVGRVVVGKQEVVDLLLVALFCQGHVLLEDVPGIGKTTLAKTLARSLGCSFRRIQFTPDLLPADITGVSIFDQRTNDFDYRPGPIMAQIVLADEINRAGPRTQSALLEAMQERQVTVDGETRPLPQPFLVLATQNPIELEGTFPLPEAQIDRFLMRVHLGYPDLEEEREILRRFRRTDPLTAVSAVVSDKEVLAAGQLCREVYVHPTLETYLLQIVHLSRHSDAIRLGISPRGSLALYQTAQAYAAIQGRAFVIPDDIKRLAPYILNHRIVLATDARLRGRTESEVLDDLLTAVTVPVEEVWAVDDAQSEVERQ